jgi:hypothetical protein
MTESARRKFLVLYLPTAVIEEWRKTDPASREQAEQATRADWMQWMNDHSEMVRSTEAGGVTKRVTAGGVADARNDVMLVSVVESDSHDAAAKAFENHPHLRIPQSSIEVMALGPMGGM